MNSYEWLLLQLTPEEGAALKATKELLAPDIEGITMLYSESWVLTLQAPQHVTEDLLSIFVAELLESGFTWQCSPQGYAYWMAVCNKYRVRAGIPTTIHIARALH